MSVRERVCVIESERESERERVWQRERERTKTKKVRISTDKEGLHKENFLVALNH